MQGSYIIACHQGTSSCIFSFPSKICVMPNVTAMEGWANLAQVQGVDGFRGFLSSLKLHNAAPLADPTTTAHPSFPAPRTTSSTKKPRPSNHQTTCTCVTPFPFSCLQFGRFLGPGALRCNPMFQFTSQQHTTPSQLYPSPSTCHPGPPVRCPHMPLHDKTALLLAGIHREPVFSAESTEQCKWRSQTKMPVSPLPACLK